METFKLTRKEMANLLLALRDEENPVQILKEAWNKRHPNLTEQEAVNAFLSTQLSPIFEKIIKSGKVQGTFSINEIVALGSQIEHSEFKLTAVQNWAKRDAKEIIGAPDGGKKYSVYQAAMLFIIDDLKTVLDFTAIKNLLLKLFKQNGDYSDDVINPLDLYFAYSSIFEDLDPDGDQLMEAEDVDPSLAKIQKERTLEALIEKRAREYVDTHIEGLNEAQKKLVQNTIAVTVLTIQISFLQSVAKRYTNLALFF
ncbi:DUF1836 domain-containing protein [Neobacillus rhizosphaerae]|uniref:DUF1836 domain-containing protein n=1 Tax=Neobacillus rhizosphaerae TaxID=2880965 RepID=UPI003D29A8EC